MHPRSVLAAVVLAALVASCSAGANPAATTGSPTATTTTISDRSDPGDLADPPPGVVGREWFVVAILDGDDEIFPPEDAVLTVQFDADSVSGSAGCNLFQGDVTFAASQVEIGPLALTERACLDVDDWVPMLSILESATQVELLGNSLFIWAGDDRALFLR